MSQAEDRGAASATDGGNGSETADGAGAVGPQRLQTAIRITTPASWIIGTVFAFLTVAVIVWGVLGELQTRVGGLGVTLSEEGDIVIARSLVAGTVLDLPVSVGSAVKKDDVIARIGQPGQEAEIAAAQQRAKLLQEQYDRRSEQTKRDLEQRKAEIGQKQNVLNERKSVLRERIDYLRQLLADLETQLTQRLVTEERVQSTREKLAQARVELSQMDVDISEAQLDYLEFEDQRESALAELERALSDAKEQRDTLVQTRKAETEIRASADGVVAEIDTVPGAVVAQGAPIARIDAEGGKLRVVGFFKAADGKKISRGMEASVAPSTAERSLWGTIVGEVTRVSELPATLDSVANTLGNRDQAEQVFSSGPPIVVEVELKTDPDTPSGLEWSSGDGPPYSITIGTTSGVSVVVRREAPANLVIPVFRRWVGHGS